MSYVIVSDIHAHKWSLFSTSTAGGVNGRLQIIIDELERAAAHAIAIGARFMVIAGDILHVRGSIDPEVLNPLQDAIRRILKSGLDIYAIPGNHDLAGKETEALGNAMRTLGETQSAGTGRFYVLETTCQHNIRGHKMGFVPWCSTTDGLMGELEKLAKISDHANFDVIIHAGIDGVLPNVGHGLTQEMLKNLGFRNVFAGHYHNHKDLGDGIWSIGATTHQTWSDVGSNAGFLEIGDDGSVKFHRTHAPQFIDVTGLDEMDMELASDGNYVRFSSSDLTVAEIDTIKRQFMSWGVKGVSILAPRKVAQTRRTTTTKRSGASLAESITGYVDAHTDIPSHIDREKVKAASVDILNKVQAVSEEA